MNWLGKLFLGGSSLAEVVGNGGGGGRSSPHPPQVFGGENVVGRAPPRPSDDRSRAEKEKKEKEDLDHAIALFQAEEMKRPIGGHRFRTSNVEETARALHNSLNSPHAPPYAAYHSRDCRLCDGCHRGIGYGKCLEVMGQFFHPECFRCHTCGYPITETKFPLSGKYPYHMSCFKELTHPKCEVCHQFIPTNAAGFIEYKCHPFWSQMYCPAHEHDNTVRCCSCERLESCNARYFSLGDGRSLCSECLEFAIMDTGDCQPLYRAIRDFFEGMNMRLDQQIPMLLVERQAINEAIVGEKNLFHRMPETRGLCLYEEQTVTSIQRRPKTEGRQLVGMRTQTQKLTRTTEITAVLVLYGLPRLLTGAILVHEMMHSWLRLKGYLTLDPEVEEGICQVLSHIWLESEVLPGSRAITSTSIASSSASSSSKKGAKSGVEHKLGEFLMHQIANDPSQAYGGGFRAANDAVNKYGLRRTLDHVRLVGKFPL